MSTDTGTSVDSAVTKLRGMLSEPEQPTDTQEQQPAKKSQDEVETLEQSDTEPKSRRFKAKLDDRDIEFEVLTDDVDLDLLPKGLMMESDYRQKTMSLSEERKAFAAEQAKLAEKVKDLEDTLQLDLDDLESPEMQELREYDPDAYLKKYEQAKRKAEKLDKYRKEVAEKKAKDKQAKIDSEFAKWPELVPEWLDQDVMKADVEKAVKTLRDVGFKDDEMADYYDARLMAVFRKAAMYDEMSTKSLETKKAKSVQKSSNPASAEALRDVQSDHSKAVARLKKSGKLSDAQEALKAFL